MSMINVSKLIKKNMGDGVHHEMIDGIYFQLKPLTDEMIDLVSGADSYEGALSLASNMGIVCDSERLYDNENVRDFIDVWVWDDESIKNSEACIRQRVGELVCDITGDEDLNAYTEELKKQAVIDGDTIYSKDLSSIDTAELNEHASMALNS